MTVYAYIRASTVEQQDTLKVQEEKIKQYCAFKDMETPKIFIESGVSGSIEFKKRPEGGKIWNEMKTGDIIVVNKLDRISRNVADFCFMINHFNKNKIIFHCLEPNIDISSSFGLFMCHILSSVSELERNMTIDRVKATIKKRKENNECIGSIPYGYSKTDDKKLIEDKEEQDNMRRIVELYYNKNNNKKISEIMNELKIPNRGGKKWYPENIKRILVKKGIYKKTQ